jgi:hypothetical protein
MSVYWLIDRVTQQRDGMRRKELTDGAAVSACCAAAIHPDDHTA